MSNEELWREYERLHACCPQCGNNSMEQTLMGIILPLNATLSDIIDRNTASCGCGWKGEVHDMIPKFKAIVVIKREQIPYRERAMGPITYVPGCFELEVISAEGILPSKYNVGSTIELVLDEQA